MRAIIHTLQSITPLQKVTIILSLTLLIMSLTQPAFYIDWEENPAAWADSWLLFFFGWTFPLGGAIIPFLIWCANPIYIASVITTIKGKTVGFYLSILSTLIAFSFSQLDSIIASESGRHSTITSLELGYKFWLGSFIVMAIGTGLTQFLETKKQQNGKVVYLVKNS
ncbi:MAG: hypothetical protein ACO1OF_04455 [Adhaeribacter sp.]